MKKALFLFCAVCMAVFLIGIPAVLADEVQEIKGTFDIWMIVPEDLGDIDPSQGISLIPVFSIISDDTVYELEFTDECELAGLDNKKEHGMTIKIAGRDVTVNTGEVYIVRGIVTPEMHAYEGKEYPVVRNNMPVKKVKVMYFEYVAPGSEETGVNAAS